jgi:AraC-like DNA-binding protein
MRCDWQVAGREAVTLQHHALGQQLTLNEACGDALLLSRTSVMVERASTPVFFMNLLVSGQARLLQAGRVQEAAPGDLMLMDSQQPYALEVTGERHHMLSLRVPYAALGSAAPLLRHCCAVAREHGAPWLSGAMAGLLRSCVGWNNSADPNTGDVLADALLGLLCTLPTAAASHLSSHRSDAERVNRCIAERHAEPGLGPTEVAVSLGMPVRRLHALCAANGSTCMEMVYRYRLERARGLLLRAPAGRWSMAELASTCGFASAAHFSRRFVQRFGIPPSALRARR